MATRARRNWPPSNDDYLAKIFSRTSGRPTMEFGDEQVAMMVNSEPAGLPLASKGITVVTTGLVLHRSAGSVIVAQLALDRKASSHAGQPVFAYKLLTTEVATITTHDAGPDAVSTGPEVSYLHFVSNILASVADRRSYCDPLLSTEARACIAEIADYDLQHPSLNKAVAYILGQSVAKT